MELIGARFSASELFEGNYFAFAGSESEWQMSIRNKLDFAASRSEFSYLSPASACWEYRAKLNISLLLVDPPIWIFIMPGRWEKAGHE